MTARDLVSIGERLAMSVTILGGLLDLLDSFLSHQEEVRYRLEQVARSNEQLSDLLDTRDPTRSMPDVSKDTHDWDVE